ncbi:unnamed protein product [Sphagnum compactum]
MARTTDSLFCLPLNPTVTFLPIRHFFVIASRTFAQETMLSNLQWAEAAVNKEEALILQFASSLPRILPVVQAGPWHPPEQYPATFQHSGHPYHGFNFMSSTTGPAATAHFGFIALSSGICAQTRSVINLNQMWTPLCATSTK